VTLRRFEIYSFDGPEEAVEAFAAAARECARFIPEVLHSAIGRCAGTAPLNFAWEQAYASPAEYRRYMEHPYHAARLDRYLMLDSPECVLTDNGLGVGLIGYSCEPGEYFLPGGARRVLALRLRDGAAAEFDRLAAGERGRGGMVLSLFKENTFGSRWFDGETPIGPPPAVTHIWEQGFDSLAAALDYGEPWRAAAEGMVEAAVEVVYALEPGYGYYD
jgi:hypothetical protein